MIPFGVGAAACRRTRSRTPAGRQTPTATAPKTASPPTSHSLCFGFRVTGGTVKSSRRRRASPPAADRDREHRGEADEGAAGDRRLEADVQRTHVEREPIAAQVGGVDDPVGEHPGSDDRGEGHERGERDRDVRASEGERRNRQRDRAAGDDHQQHAVDDVEGPMVRTPRSGRFPAAMSSTNSRRRRQRHRGDQRGCPRGSAGRPPPPSLEQPRTSTAASLFILRDGRYWRLPGGGGGGGGGDPAAGGGGGGCCAGGAWPAGGAGGGGARRRRCRRNPGALLSRIASQPPIAIRIERRKPRY